MRNNRGRCILLPFKMIIIFLLFSFVSGQSVFYESFTGKILSTDEVKDHITRNTTFWCVNEIQPCDPYEGRRVDGSCNNLKNPNRGAAHTPMLRALPADFDTGRRVDGSCNNLKNPNRGAAHTPMLRALPADFDTGRRVDGSCNNLKNPNRGAAHTPMLRALPADFDTDFEPRRSKTGESLPNARSLRTAFLAEGRVPDRLYTHLLTHFWVFMTSDVLSLHDTVNYAFWKPYCCEERGKLDRECIPSSIPEDDVVHRFSTYRCMNLTRPVSFQSQGCAKNDTQPERIVSATSVFDLSHVYGSHASSLNERGRAFTGGLLKTEVEKDKIFPPSSKSPTTYVCLLNKLPQERRCHDGPDSAVNSVLGLNLFFIWSWRMHNRIATVLSTLNPCWDDDKLFWTARDINIALTMQIYYYELMPALMGRENLLYSGILSPSVGHRHIYNEYVLPQIYLEFPYVLRWAHTIQEGIVKHYDPQGNIVKEAKIVDLTLKTGYLVDNLEYITQGAFRQAAAKPDYTVDPDISEKILGDLQAVSDVLTSDLRKGRYTGIPPYIKYRQLCSGKVYKTFEDLEDVIDPERIQLLKEKYKNVEDIDLLAGVWLEKHYPGSKVPPTLYCIVVKQMARTMVSDRHWYESPYRPNAFTLEQLLEIRKANIAQYMCVVGDTVTQIQPHAFFAAGPGNEFRDCQEIEKIDLWAWKDYTCDNNPYQPFTI